jgi:hypothetical protein
MTRLLASIVAVIFVAGSIVMGAAGPVAEHPELVSIKKQYQADMEPVRKRYRTRLESLQKELTRKGDLDGALAVKGELEAFSGGEKTSVEKPPAKTPAVLKGTWTVLYSPSGNTRKYVISEDGKVELVGEKLTGKITKNGDDFLLDLNDGKLERLAVKEVLFIEHYYDKARYTMGERPEQTATGDKAKGK